MGLSSLPEDKKTKKFRLLSAFITLGVLLLWYLANSEAEPWTLLPGDQESSRFRTLRSIATAANQGHYFQLEPGIPMETHWEDPGTGFFMVWLGLVKKAVLRSPLDVSKDPYRVEFLIIVLPLLFLFFTRLFSLPRWYWFIPPAFFILSAIPFYEAHASGLTKSSSLLHLSISARWAKVPAAFWIFTMNVQFFEWWKNGSLFLMSKKRCLGLFLCGLIFGVLISVRKDILVSLCMSFAGVLLFFVFRDPHSKKRNIGVVGLMLLSLYAGHLATQGFISLTWKVRDHFYTMKKDFPRIYGHPTWHSLYAALGEITPDKKIRWGDEDAWNDVLSIPENRSLRYGSPEHEKAARKLYLKTISSHPISFIRGLIRKTGILVKGNYKLLGLSFLLAGIIGWKFRAYWELCLILAISTLSSAVVPILVIPDIIYSYDFRANTYLAVIVGLEIIALGLRRSHA